MAMRPHDTKELQRTPTRPPAPAGVGEAYDVERIRADFPILYRDVYGKPLVYLDNAASAQKPRQVIEAMDHVYRFEYANVHRGLHFLSNLSTSKYEDARELVQRFLNAGSQDEIIFTRNATAAINLVADSFGANIGEGDEIVLSIMEHHSNIVPWHFLRERRGAVLKWAPIADDGELLLDEFERLLEPAHQARRHHAHVERARHGGAGEGDHPARARARHPGARRRQPVGGAHAGRRARPRLRLLRLHRPQDLRPHRHRRALRQEGAPRRHAPYQGGGNMIESVHVDRIAYGKPPQKFEAGTPPIVEAIGLGAALNYMMQVGRDKIARHEAELSAYAHAQLAELPWLKIYGTAPGKGAIVSFTIDGLHPHDIATIIDRSGVAVRAGHHCAQPLMERLGDHGDVPRLVRHVQHQRRKSTRWLRR